MSGHGTRLVYVSPVSLSSFAQRPHHFVRWFRDRFAAQVLWIEPYPARLPRLQDLRRLQPQPDTDIGPDWRRESWLERLRVPALPFEPLAPGRRMNRLLWRSVLERIDGFVDGSTWLVAGKPCALALTLAQRHPGIPLLFDVMDNVPAFTSGLSRRWLSHAEAMLAQESDLIVTASTALHDKFAPLRGKLQLVRNGLTPPTDADAEAAHPGATGRTVFGYVGSISTWFDWDAVVELAARHPQDTVRLIGPCDRAPRHLPPNVELLPAIAQHRVYAALREFSVGLIPFKVNDLTEFVDPVKYYEYRALGLPVLSTRFGEMRLRGADDRVLFFDDRVPASALAEMRAAASDPIEVMEFRRSNSWRQRFDALDWFFRRDSTSMAR